MFLNILFHGEDSENVICFAWEKKTGCHLATKQERQILEWDVQWNETYYRPTERSMFHLECFLFCSKSWTCAGWFQHTNQTQKGWAQYEGNENKGVSLQSKSAGWTQKGFWFWWTSWIAYRQRGRHKEGSGDGRAEEGKCLVPSRDLGCPENWQHVLVRHVPGMFWIRSEEIRLKGFSWSYFFHMIGE